MTSPVATPTKIPPQPYTPEEAGEQVRVVALNIPFSMMVSLVFKWACACVIVFLPIAFFGWLLALVVAASRP